MQLTKVDIVNTVFVIFFYNSLSHMYSLVYIFVFFSKCRKYESAALTKELACICWQRYQKNVYICAHICF